MKRLTLLGILYCLSFSGVAQSKKYLLCEMTQFVDGERGSPISTVLHEKNKYYLASVVVDPLFGRDYYSEVFKVFKDSRGSEKPKYIDGLTFDGKRSSGILKYFGSYRNFFGDTESISLECHQTDDFDEVLAYGSDESHKVNTDKLYNLKD